VAASTGPSFEPTRPAGRPIGDPGEGALAAR